MDIVNRQEFDRIATELESGVRTVNLADIGKIFGQPFWELLVVCLIDAKYSMLPEQIKMERGE